MVFSSIQKGNKFWNNKRSIHANKHQNQIHQNGVFPRGGINLTQALTIAVHSTAAFRRSIFGVEMIRQSTRRHPCTHRVSTPSRPRPRSPAPFLAALLDTNETLFGTTTLFCRFESSSFYLCMTLANTSFLVILL